MAVNEEKIILRGKKVMGGIAEGEALVSPKPIMGWGNVDEKLGIIKERNHPLKNIPLKGKVLIFPEPRGSGGFVQYGRTKAFGQNPVAMVCREGNSLVIFASLISKIPTVMGFDEDPSQIIQTGDYVRVNGDEGTVEIIRRKNES